MSFFKAHASGSKKRVKIRTRKYVDSDLHFFEYKQKANKRVTKFRYEMSGDEFGVMNQSANEFCVWVDSEYNLMPTEWITPALENSYQRVTLCNMNAQERVTIDYNIGFVNPRTWKTARIDNIAIIETKSATQPSPTSILLQQQCGITPQWACSKYCIGLYMTNAVQDPARFESTIHHITALQAEYASSQLVQSMHSNLS